MTCPRWIVLDDYLRSAYARPLTPRELASYRRLLTIFSSRPIFLGSCICAPVIHGSGRNRHAASTTIPDVASSEFHPILRIDRRSIFHLVPWVSALPSARAWVGLTAHPRSPVVFSLTSPVPFLGVVAVSIIDSGCAGIHVVQDS